MAENRDMTNDLSIREGSSGTSHLTTDPETANKRMIARLGEDIKGRGMQKIVRRRKKSRRTHIPLTASKLTSAKLRAAFLGRKTKLSKSKKKKKIHKKFSRKKNGSKKLHKKKKK